MKKEKFRNVKYGGIIVLMLIAMVLLSGCLGGGSTKPIPNTQEKTKSISPTIEAPKGLPAESSVASPYEKSIVGRWAKLDKDNPVIIQFSGSGSVVMIVKLPGEKDPTIATGIYRFLSADSIEMTYPVKGGSGYYSMINRVVGVSDTSLTLEDQDGLNTVDLIKMRTDK